MESTYNRQYIIKIVVKTKFGNGEVVETLKWENLRFDVLNKWKWYFKYRAALLQVKYPRYYVDYCQFSEEATGLTKQQLDDKIKQREISNCKGMITKISNAIENYEKQQQNTLIPNYKSEKYLNTKAKLQEYIKKLENLQK